MLSRMSYVLPPLQNLRLTKPCLLLPPSLSQPGSSSPVPPQQQSPGITTSSPATCELPWPERESPLQSTRRFGADTRHWFWSAACAGGATYPEAFVHPPRWASSRAERGAAAPQPVVALTQERHSQGNSSVKARELPPATEENASYCTELCSVLAWVLLLVVAPFSFLGNENKSKSQELFCDLLV